MLALDRTRFLRRKARRSERARPGRLLERQYRAPSLRALPSLRPRSWGIDYGTGKFGNEITLSTSGTDAVGHHAFVAKIAVETEDVGPLGTLDYWYSGLPFGVRAAAFRTAAPREDYRIGDNDDR